MVIDQFSQHYYNQYFLIVLIKYESAVIIIRYESFENLEEAKKQAIINAGFKAFGENGYTKASVDAIVQEAKISKGSLFYYFESKLNFFLYLYAYCGLQMERLIDHPDENGLPSYLEHTDFFDRLNAVQLLKMKYSAEFPYMNRYIKRAASDTAPAVKDGIVKINAQFSQKRALAFYQNLDFYKFKEGIDPKMVIQLVSWCAEGCANQIVFQGNMNSTPNKTPPDFKELYILYQSYMELFRNNFYKEEYL